MTDWKEKVREAKRKAAWARKKVRQYQQQRYAVEAKVDLQRARRKLERDIDTEKNLLVKRANGDIYMVNLVKGRVLDIGRGLVMDFDEGIISEVNQEVLAWESKRRIVRDCPNITMHVVREALGVGDDSGPALPMQGANPNNWLPVWGDSEDE